MLKLLLSARSHKETERASGKGRVRKGEMKQGGSERNRGTGGGDMIAAARKKVKGQ